eukprot:scaffold1593_cov193-Alexandrium_tamarense.AAC.63
MLEMPFQSPSFRGYEPLQRFQSYVDTADLRSNITSLLEKITVTLSRDHMLACRSESGCEVPINIDEECEPYGMELKEQISAGTSSNQRQSVEKFNGKLHCPCYRQPFVYRRRRLMLVNND